MTISLLIILTLDTNLSYDFFPKKNNSNEWLLYITVRMIQTNSSIVLEKEEQRLFKLKK